MKPNTTMRKQLTLPGNIQLADISPTKHERYSPNLHQWLNSAEHRRHIHEEKVWKCEEGYLWIGWIYDGDLIGAKLISILCNGSKEGSTFYSGMRLGEIQVVGYFENNSHFVLT